MINKTSARKLYVPVLIFFVIINGPLVVGHLPQRFNIDQGVVIIGNLILFAATMLSLFLYQRALVHASTHGFLRNAYSGLIVKLMICLISVGVYAAVERANINRQAIFVCVLLYLIYSVIEMRSLMRWNKERTNA
jgi:hypothetical protein